MCIIFNTLSKVNQNNTHKTIYKSRSTIYNIVNSHKMHYSVLPTLYVSYDGPLNCAGREEKQFKQMVTTPSREVIPSRMLRICLTGCPTYDTSKIICDTSKKFM